MRFLFLNILFFILAFPSVFGQLSDSKIKSNSVINIAKFIEWESEDTIERFSIGVFGSDEIYEEFRNDARYRSIKNKRFDVVQFKKVNDIGGVHILFVDNKKNHALNKILEISIAEKILMFSDSCLNWDLIMINLLDLDMPGNQFEINMDNIDKAHFHVSPKLLYYGGSEEDLRDLYQASERELSSVQKDLEEQTAALEKQRKELEVKKREILALNEEIVLQEKRLRSMTSEVEAKQDSLDKKVALLEKQSVEIRKQQASIDQQNEQLLSQKREIEAGNTFLDKQKLEIEAQEQKIEKQQREIRVQTQTLGSQTREIEAQTIRIEKQQTLLYFFIAFFVLIAAMVFFILRAYRIKRQANKKLEEKNIAISKQKEEIQFQQEQLKRINQKIERQNENIKSSIHYALTIQQALLPSKREMSDPFESFVIYRPKDIVSGDFYWMGKVASEKGLAEKIFVAVADCTGHGVPGAFLSMIGIKLLNSIVNERKQYDPRVILEMLNKAVQEALKQEKSGTDDGMDICLCRLEKAKGDKIEVTFSGARRPLYYSSGQKINILPGDRKTVGGRFYKKQVFTNQKLILEPGDRIYLTSDGIADQNAPNRKKFGSKKLVQLLGESFQLPMAEQQEILEKTLDNFQQNEKQRDDISLMAIKL